MNSIDYLEFCNECNDYFEKSEGAEVGGKFYCHDCSNRCIECDSIITEENAYRESFCSRDCCNLYFHDLYEDEWKNRDNQDEY